jgi:hypothetical protein
MFGRLTRLLILLSALSLTACGGQGETDTLRIPQGVPREAQSLTVRAIADLAERKDVPLDEISLKSVEPTEFPDASLGVPEPGRSYAEVITPGYVIKLEHDGEMYEYHGAENRIVMVPKEE